MANQPAGVYDHGAPVTQHPTHGGLVPTHGGLAPTHGANGLPSGGAPVPWLPTNDGVRKWYDFTSPSRMFTDTAGTTPVVNDGDVIARVSDRGIEADHAIQTNAARRPTFRTASNVDGLPGLRNPGGDSGLQIVGDWGDLGELMTVTDINSLQAFAGPIVASGIGPGQTHVIILQWDNSGGAGNGTVKWYRDGAQYGSTTSGLTLANSGIFAVVCNLLTAGNFSAGRIVTPQWLFNRAALGRGADGDFRHVAHFNVSSDPIRERLEGFLMHDTSLALPGGHPYESAPPMV